MCDIIIKLNDGIITIPITKALLIPKIRDIIKNKDNREYYLMKIIESNYSEIERNSILNQLKK